MSNYDVLFVKYSKNTDGKKKISNTILNYAQKNNLISLLDIGAGDGTLTNLLSKKFKKITVIEPNPCFWNKLQHISGIRLIKSNAEHIKNFNDKFDCILLCYSLSYVDFSHWKELLERFSKIKSDKGIILGISYLEGCDWDIYSEVIGNHLKYDRWGGYFKYKELLNKLGYETRIIQCLKTKIWGNSEIELYENLSFFFDKSVKQYTELYDKVEILRNIFFKFTSKNRVYIDVEEVIFEIINVTELRERINWK